MHTNAHTCPNCLTKQSQPSFKETANRHLMLMTLISHCATLESMAHTFFFINEGKELI